MEGELLMIDIDMKVASQPVKAQDLLPDGSSAATLTSLIGCAILAPPTHNAQPWKFSITGNEIQLFADRRRWLKVADPDQREMFVSVGCALENMLVAAEHFGYRFEVAYFPSSGDQDLVASIQFSPFGQPSDFRDAALFEAISGRHTNRKVFDSRPIPQADLMRLETCCAERYIYLHMTDDSATKDKLDELMFYADAVEFANPAFRAELADWMRPALLSRSWLLAKVGQFAAAYLSDGEVEAAKDSRALRSAPVFALVSSREDDRESQVLAGQAFERIWLTATALGISVQPMNQILHIPGLGADVTRLIPAPHVCPQIMFRLGYAELEKRHTPRRPLKEVLLQVT